MDKLTDHQDNRWIAGQINQVTAWLTDQRTTWPQNRDHTEDGLSHKSVMLPNHDLQFSCTFIFPSQCSDEGHSHPWKSAHFEYFQGANASCNQWLWTWRQHCNGYTNIIGIEKSDFCMVYILCPGWPTDGHTESPFIYFFIPWHNVGRFSSASILLHSYLPTLITMRHTSNFIFSFQRQHCQTDKVLGKMVSNYWKYRKIINFHFNEMLRNFQMKPTYPFLTGSPEF